jgi:hypothetical protein
MRVLLKLVLDCEPDAAWRAIRSPSVLNAVSSPLTRFESLEPAGFPILWPAGDHPVAMRAPGGITIGEQVIAISYPAVGSPGSGTRAPSASAASAGSPGAGSASAGSAGTDSASAGSPSAGSASAVGAVRVMRDTGWGLSGPLVLVTRWEHTMSIADAAGGRTLYRDQLVFEAGRFTLLLWPAYWAFWQWRALGIKRLASGWTA